MAFDQTFSPPGASPRDYDFQSSAGASSVTVDLEEQIKNIEQQIKNYTRNLQEETETLEQARDQLKAEMFNISIYQCGVAAAVRDVKEQHRQFLDGTRAIQASQRKIDDQLHSALLQRNLDNLTTSAAQTANEVRKMQAFQDQWSTQLQHLETELSHLFEVYRSQQATCTRHEALIDSFGVWSERVRETMGNALDVIRDEYRTRSRP